MASCEGSCLSSCVSAAANSTGSMTCNNCASSCYSACSNTCTGSCENGCTSCTSDCSGECKYVCSYNCFTTCGSGCSAGCTQGCYSGCRSECIDSCTMVCIKTCGIACESSSQLMVFTNFYTLDVSTFHEVASKRNVLLISLDGKEEGVGCKTNGYYIYPTLGGQLRIYKYANGKLTSLLTTLKYTVVKDVSSSIVGEFGDVKGGVYRNFKHDLVFHNCTFDEYLAKIACTDPEIAQIYENMIIPRMVDEDNNPLPTYFRFNEMVDNVTDTYIAVNNAYDDTEKQALYKRKAYDLVRKIYNDMTRNVPDLVTDIFNAIYDDLTTNFKRNGRHDAESSIRQELIRYTETIEAFLTNVIEWTWNNINY